MPSFRVEPPTVSQSAAVPGARAGDEGPREGGTANPGAEEIVGSFGEGGQTVASQESNLSELQPLAPARATETVPTAREDRASVAASGSAEGEAQTAPASPAGEASTPTSNVESTLPGEVAGGESSEIAQTLTIDRAWLERRRQKAPLSLAKVTMAATGLTVHSAPRLATLAAQARKEHAAEPSAGDAHAVATAAAAAAAAADSSLSAHTSAQIDIAQAARVKGGGVGGVGKAGDDDVREGVDLNASAEAGEIRRASWRRSSASRTGALKQLGKEGGVRREESVVGVAGANLLVVGLSSAVQLLRAAGKAHKRKTRKVSDECLCDEEDGKGGRRQPIETGNVATSGAAVEDLYRSSRTVRHALAALTVYIATGLVIYMNVEGWSAIDCMYFSMATITTVGYGDVAPKTAAGKVLTIFYAMEGLGMLLELISMMGRYMIDTFLSQHHMSSQSPPQSSTSLGGLGRSLAHPHLLYYWEKIPSRLRTLLLSRCIMWMALSIGMLFYGSLEAENLSYFNALYMSAMTITSVGYGDFSPKTQTGRAFAIVWLPLSCMMAGYALSMVVKTFIRESQETIRYQVLKQRLTSDEMADVDDDQDGIITQSEYILYKIEKMGLVPPDEINRIAMEFFAFEKHSLAIAEYQASS